MDKKIKFSDKATVSKVVYSAIIAILCVSAIVIGIVVANNRKPDATENPPAGDITNPPEGENPTPDSENNTPTPPPEVKLSFVSPAVGTVMKSHSTTVPVFSNTLDAWRTHTGMDIGTEEGAEVYAAEAGEVIAYYKHPMLGYTIEIKHDDKHKSIYSNLNADSITLAVGAKVAKGDCIGRVGDSAIIEIADEPHLHFEMVVDGTAVNPLDYITEESKSASLGIVTENQA